MHDFKIKPPIIAFADTATSAKQTADYSAIVVAAKTESGQILILYSFHVKYEFPDLINWCKKELTSNKVGAFYVEDASSGRQVIQTLKSELEIPVLAFPAGKDKVSKVNAVLPYFEGGKVILSKEGNHYNLVNECLQFPFGKNDDLVDALVGAVTVLSRPMFGSVFGWKPAKRLPFIYGR